MKTNNKKTNRRSKKTAKKVGWFSGMISKIKNGKVMKKVKGLLTSASNCIASVVDWVDLHEHKIHSLLIIGFGLMLLCPVVEPWTLVGVLALLVGAVRLLMRR